jgi:hypothetical protein
MPSQNVTYKCWSNDCHHEDVTEAVTSSAGDSKVPVFELAEPPAKQAVETWRVLVTCSKSHRNVFAGPNPGQSEVTGRHPTAEDEYWAGSGAVFATDKSLDRIESKAGFVFQNVTLIGTILAGIGVLVGITSPSSAHPILTYVLLVMLFLAVGLALFATTPSTRGSINPANLTDLKRYFTRVIPLRGWFTRIAMYVFAAAVVVAFIFLLLAVRAPTSPTVSIQLAGDPAKAEVTAEVREERLPAGAVATTVVEGMSGGKPPSLLAEDVSEAGSSGEIDAKIAVSDLDVESFDHLQVRTSTEVDGQTVESRTFSVPVFVP